MKDLDDLLTKSSAPAPRRALKADFTEQVLGQLDGSPKREWWARYLELPFQRLPKPLTALLAIACALVIGGSAYAVVSNWPDTSATLKETKQLKSGNHIVAVDLENCAIAQDADSTKLNGEHIDYYELKRGVDISKFVHTVGAICEENVANVAVESTVKRLGMQYQDPLGSQIVTAGTLRIKAISADSITFVAARVPAGSDPSEVLQPITYDRFAKDLEVYDRGIRISYTDLRAGDTIKVVGLYEQARDRVRDPKYWDDPSIVILQAIVRVPLDSQAVETFQSRASIDFVRLEPCDSPSGFCREFPFKDEF